LITSAPLTGDIVGFSIATPIGWIGPIGASTIRRTLAEGRPMGLLTGLGAATADAVYGAAAAFGVAVPRHPG
jgi:threonine/homoserine/homoserine lactone efflux protein